MNTLIRWLAVLLLPTFLVGAARADEPAARPKLAVMVVFDQMRGDYLSKWYDQFSQGGFRRLLDEGAWFDNCNYPYALTLTGPGHASLLTGCSPDKHGIIGNDWYERGKGTVYCATTERYRPVPEGTRGTSRRYGGGAGGSPDRLLAPSLGDVLKESTGGKGRVLAISYKDRAAILPGGHKPNAAYWMDSATGQIVTSTYYMPAIPSWVQAFNDSKFADQWFGKKWERLRPDLDYAKLAGPDDVAGEGSGYKQGRVFPHPMSEGLTKPALSYYEALVTSPFSNNVVLEFAKKAIVAEHLGEDEIPDLLAVSFSGNDYIGHVWGPDSQEVLDVTLRSDLIVKELLEFLDEHVGKGRYVLVMSADHGVCPLPEVARAQGKDGVRVSGNALLAGAERHLDEELGPRPAGSPKWIESSANFSLVLNRKVMAAKGVPSEKVESALVNWLKKQPDVLTAYTRAELLQPAAEGDEIGRRVRKSFNPERSGEVSVVFKPYHLVSPFLDGTTHGSPHPYDTHVPLVAYGTGVVKGRRHDAVTPQASAAILAHALGIKPPAMAEAPVPEGLFQAGAATK